MQRNSARFGVSLYSLDQGLKELCTADYSLLRSDISDNQFTGNPPTSFASINLNLYSVVNLKGNYFDGVAVEVRQDMVKLERWNFYVLPQM